MVARENASNHVAIDGSSVLEIIAMAITRARGPDNRALPPHVIDAEIAAFACFGAPKILYGKGTKKPTPEGSSTARTVCLLQLLLPLSRIIYASATGASESSHMRYMLRLG